MITVNETSCKFCYVTVEQVLCSCRSQFLPLFLTSCTSDHAVLTFLRDLQSNACSSYFQPLIVNGIVTHTNRGTVSKYGRSRSVCPLAVPNHCITVDFKTGISIERLPSLVLMSWQSNFWRIALIIRMLSWISLGSGQTQANSHD